MKFKTNSLAVLALASALVGRAGEWVTSESTGAPVCQLQQDILYPETSLSVGFCGNWMVPRPMDAMTIAPFVDWLRCPAGGRTCQLHFKHGWRP